MRSVLWWGRTAGVVGVLGIVACGGGDSPTEPKNQPGVRSVAGGGVTDTVLAAPLQALVVEVRGAGGSLASGVTVRFEVKPPTDSTRLYEAPLYVCPLSVSQCGSGYNYGFTSAADTTDANGRAKVTVRLGTVAGPAYVRVSVPEFGLLDSVPFTVRPGGAKSAGFTARAVGVTVGGKVTVQAFVRDAYGNARTEAPVLSYAGAAGVATLDAASRTITGQDIGTGWVYARYGAAADSVPVRVVPAGRLLVWDAYAHAVALVNVDGSTPRVFASNVDSDYGTFPRFGPSRATVVLHTGGSSGGGTPLRIVVVDTTGANRREIAAPANVTAVTYPRLLANGAVLFVGRKPYPAGTYWGPQPTALFRADADGNAVEVAALPDASADYGGVDVSPDGARVAYVAADEYGASTNLRVLTVASGEVTEVDASGGAPRWSPDGRRLAYLAGPTYARTVMTTWAVDGAARTQLPSAGNFLGLGGLAWSPDGAYLLGYVDGYSGDGGLRVVRARDGVSVPLAIPRLSEQTFSGVYYQPDWR